MMRTELTRLAGVDVPVVAAPMAGVADAGLAVAVSRAGGLGCIGIGSSATVEWTRAQIEIAAAAEVPYGVGFMGWALARDASTFELALDARPRLVSLAFVDPIVDLAPWVDRAHDAEALVAIQIGTVAEARDAAGLGADLIVARGGEAGGHGRDTVATIPLLQAVLDGIDTPVLAAGGIAGPRGLAAALAAGAAGAWVGTAFAACAEATSSPAARVAMSEAEASDTIHTRVFDIAQRLAWPEIFGGRALTNDFTATWAQRPALLQTLVEQQDSDPTVTITADMARARSGAEVGMAPVYCGQGVGQIRADVPAAEIVADFARAADLLRRAASDD